MDDVTPSSSGWFKSKKSRSLDPQTEPPVSKGALPNGEFEWLSDEGAKILLRGRPTGDEGFFAALTGVPFPVSEPGELNVVANSPLAREFVEFVDDNLRNFGTTLVADKEISSAELRGPVRWSETLSVRSASFGMDYTYVCSVQKRTYDSPENRVVVAALDKIVSSLPRSWRTSGLSINRDAVAVAVAAERILASKPLKGVTVLPLTKLGPAKKRARNARKSHLYKLALDVLDLPVKVPGAQLATEDELLALCDDVTRARCNLVVQLNEKFSEVGLGMQGDPIILDGRLSVGGVSMRGGVNGYVKFAGVQLVTPVEFADDAPGVVSIASPDDIGAFLRAALRKKTALRSSPLTP